LFEAISPGDRGPEVEDVQKRLLTLGFDLGPTGVDGVFLGSTHAAVRRFQADHDLAEDGVIGDETWSALVDATFRLGDRLLYLRVPHFHGADVARLQGALNVLGFACGGPDAIFGPFTERAVREFQANVGLPADGIAGLDTVGTLERLHHVWEGKDPCSPASLLVAPVRSTAVLRRRALTLSWLDECGRMVAERIVNLARASEPEARVSLGARTPGDDPDLELTLSCDPGLDARGLPVIVVASDAPLHGRFLAALGSAPGRDEAMIVVPDTVAAVEHDAQACAVRILDGVCAALSGEAAPVVP
jgi:peptidoglycan hydrolase-like protein with peptidoglycan-binding domain